MEFWIAFTVTFIIGSIYSMGKRAKQKEQGNVQTSAKTKAEQQQKLKQADEELITINLPTINNDK